MDNYSTIMDKLIRAKAEIETAGPVHRRDLEKHIRRLEKALAGIRKIQRGVIRH